MEQKIIVKRNDAITITEIRALQPKAIIISPGPCGPNESGICLELIKNFSGQIPILGICLGHQAIGQAFGAKIIRAQRPMHGKTSLIRHHGSALFKDIPTNFEATRYHSLIIERDAIPKCLKITAETKQGEVMAIEHGQYLVFGMQFHPESILSECGKALLRNFLHIARSQNHSTGQSEFSSRLGSL